MSSTPSPGPYTVKGNRSEGLFTVEGPTFSSSTFHQRHLAEALCHELNAAYLAGQASREQQWKHDIDPGLLLGAIDKWGGKSQVEMIQEEAMELSLALQHMRRKSKDPDKMMANVLDELADMRIMLAQADILFDQRVIRERVKFKMNRLAERLGNPADPTNNSDK
jgi:hypothetical protein